MVGKTINLPFIVLITSFSWLSPFPAKRSRLHTGRESAAPFPAGRAPGLAGVRGRLCGVNRPRYLRGNLPFLYSDYASI
jgi:hypothetical protein